jgi:ribosomal protein S18 acetylase RimI-like enzyme
VGRALVSTLLHWAQNNDAKRVFLQVEVNNAAAIGLYNSLGFEPLYRYETWALRPHQ